MRLSASFCSPVFAASTRMLSSSGRHIWQKLYHRPSAGHCLFSSGFGQCSLSSITSKARSRTGDECYNRALDALEAAEALEEKERRKHSEEQFKAWKKAQERSRNQPSLREGIAVVKTIARQTQRERQLMNGPGDEKDLKVVAMALMEQAAFEHGHGKALVRLANSALEEANTISKKALETETDIVESLVRKALRFYKTAGENGTAEGWFNLAHLMWTGFPQADDQLRVVTVIEPDKRVSMEAFKHAIALNDSDAMYFVGVQYLSNDELGHSSQQESIREGLDLIQKAADANHGGALYYLALLYRNGRDDLDIPPCSSDEFVRRLDMAASAGDPDALFLRGHCFYHGEDGYKQDYRMALTNFLDAAKKENANAAVSAGAMLHRGNCEGVKEDQPRAFELYQWAGELGSKEGWRNVAACYALGEGVPKCQKTAEYIAKTTLGEH